jgi:hypothetical protein
MKMKQNRHLGKLPPRYTFIKNPYSDYKASKCPICQKQTFKRKFALMIFIKDTYPLAQGLTCKYCSKCELIIADQEVLETELCISFEKIDPSKIGHDYFVAGTIDKKTWKKNIGKETDFENMLEYVSDFKSIQELHCEPGGWYKDDA